ncbi:unnamed protein product [Cuscuta epithymum]|uniref:histidine kinase n=1 Tax=Cuscuta epithymum TaxID=186058 RepID=A0AAV0CHL5_9ASTE|nr:unnamed protein product [Cuscuta epithymum]
MSFFHVVGFGVKLGSLLLTPCYWVITLISLDCWLSKSGGIMTAKAFFDDGEEILANLWGKISSNISRIHQSYSQYIVSKKVRKNWWVLLAVWVVFWVVVAFCAFYLLSTQVKEKRKETLASMCDERARMLQDQFNVSMNHVQAMSILISTFHHGKNPSAIDQMTFARYTERTAFERPLTSGVAYAVRVLHHDREHFEREQGWTIKRMEPQFHGNEYNVDNLEPSPIQDEYAPVIFAQDTIAHVISVDVLSGKEDRENVLRARASGKGVLTAPFKLLKTNRLGVILTFAVYKRQVPSNATSYERIEATYGYLGGVFDIESLVEKLLQQLASEQTILVNVYDKTNISDPISMYGSNVSIDHLEHISSLNFGDPFRKHEMRCRFKQKQPWPWLAIITSFGILTIALLVGQIFYATIKRIEKVEDDYHQMMELKKRAEAADVAKSQFLATVSHEIRTPMNGVLGMLHMLMDTDLDVTQQDYVRTAQASGKALVSLINEVLDQAKIESGKLELEAVSFDPREILDDVLSLFSGKSQEKGVELAVYISEKIPKLLIGDPGRFRQIITNLMGNSIKFTEKGHIFVTVHLVEEVAVEHGSSGTLSGFQVADRHKSWKEINAFNQGGSPSYKLSPDQINLIVSVEDTGVGIPYEAQHLVFTPFMQVGPSTARTHGGTGIGLSISKCLVQLMKGEIGFVSLPRIGSTFTFTAVFSDGCADSNEPSSAFSEFKGMRALVVDPRTVRAEVSKYHIQRLGIYVKVVQDLNEELLFISTEETSINMVLVEQEVWDRDSGQVTRFVNKLRSYNINSSPKLFLLANSISCTGGNTSTVGVSTPFVIMKPLRASMLAASLQRAMGVNNQGNHRSGMVSGAPPLSELLHGRKILVVDDNLVNLKVANAALRKYGADVVCTDCGENAISLLRPPHEFDACFMDIQMPRMDGFEATKRIRELEIQISNNKNRKQDEAYRNGPNGHVPILAMTADVIHATYEQCLRSGMDGYVSKPFDPEQLYREVSRFFHLKSN